MNLGRIRTGKNGRSEEAREVCCGHLGMSGKGQNQRNLGGKGKGSGGER